MESRVEERTSQLEAANKELEAFSYSVSHDLKAPLRAIEGFADALTEDFGSRLEKEAREYLQEISHGTIRMENLINDLLQHARVGRGLLKFCAVDTNALVSRVKNLLESRIEKADFRVSIVGELPVVEGHESTLILIFQNLLENAIKFVPPGQIPEIVLQSEIEDQFHHFSIRDNGIGIEEKFQNTIFKIFERLHTNEVYSGTGIGLAIVKKAVQLHDGEIWIVSSLGSGSTFHFTLSKKPQNRG